MLNKIVFFCNFFSKIFDKIINFVNTFLGGRASTQTLNSQNRLSKEWLNRFLSLETGLSWIGLSREPHASPIDQVYTFVENLDYLTPILFHTEGYVPKIVKRHLYKTFA